MTDWSSTPDTFNLTAIGDEIEQNGFAIVPDVLSADEVAEGVKRLWAAVEEQERRGLSRYLEAPDRVRLMNPADIDPFFMDLLEHPVADAILSTYLGEDYILSQYNGHVVQPGSTPMPIHSDEWNVLPEPWADCWALNIMWPLSDFYRENGATQHLPGSHRLQRYADVPSDVERRMEPFEASAGSIIAMDGRVWHCNGANVTENEDRPLLLAYYYKPFLRPATNYSTVLSPEVQNRLSPEMRYRLGLDDWLNVPMAFSFRGTPFPSGKAVQPT
jgi:fumagillin biosynthesis dioxygenase